ncbi:tetraspanin-36-like [Asterias amurensis]|uniref:tetraspanin-36-like n=1 Tax=Asterias amurensis TaxID=7602 RepID=UPI003AB524EB
MGLCNISARVLMIAVSLLFWALAAGCVFIAIELIRFIGPLTGSVVDKVVLLAPAGIMVVLTILLFVIGMTGLCGAFQESKCLHGMFCTLLVLIIGIEIAGVVCGIIYKDEVKTDLEDKLKAAINEYDANASITEAVDTLQITVECCGVKSYKDWPTTTWGKSHPLQVPMSCCKKTDGPGECTGFISHTENIYIEGCHVKLYEDIHQYLILIIVAALVFALLQVFVLGCACHLLCKKKREVPYQTLNSDDTGYRA